MKAIVRICFLFLLMTACADAAPGDPGRQLLAETNAARSDPRRYAWYLREHRGRFLGNAYAHPGSMTMVITTEGVAAVDEAIRFLSRQRPLPPLAWSPGLARAAADLVQEQVHSGATGHEGESGSIRQRIERHGAWKIGIAENISYGPGTVRLVVMELIIDDGVRGRGHRKNIFDPGFTTAGAACGPHPMYGSMCVIDFAVGYKSR